jgi:pullulanase
VGDSWKTIVVVLNGQTKAVKVTLPEGEFNYACAEGKCPAANTAVVKGSVLVAPQTAVILYQE